MKASDSTPASRWSEAWLDAAGFAGGLALAWHFRWETTDLVWSLWLSSLLVGYAIIVWSLFSPVWRAARGDSAAGAGLTVIGALFMLAFFTVHFGLFHFVHSAFLNGFFPVGPKSGGLFSSAWFGEVLQRYWWFVPLALLSEREAFRARPFPPAPPATSVKAADIAARKERKAAREGGQAIMAPYKNVIRLHLLIFFFAAAHFAKLDSFLVYAVVYAVYFFPWRLLKGEPAAGRETPA